MNIDELKGNSHRIKESATTPVEEKKVNKVVQGKVKAKKNEVRKLTDIFIAEDVSNVKNYIVMDVLVPALKKAVFDIITDGVDMILYGEAGRHRRSKKSSGEYVSYSTNYTSSRDRSRYAEPRRRESFDYEDLIFETRAEAETVREGLDDLIDRYGVANVGDLYDLAGMTAPYTANKYGWTSIRSCEAVRVRDGYILKLPKAKLID